MVSPISFYKVLAKPLVERVKAYQVLDEVIQEQGLYNPYAELLFHDPTNHVPDPFNEYLEIFQEGNKTTNTTGMEDSSILGTKITYPQTTYSESLLFLQKGPQTCSKNGPQTPLSLNN